MTRCSIKLILFLLLASTCTHSQDLKFKDIPIDTNYSFRGLSVVDDSVAWVSGVKGVVGETTNGGKNWMFHKVKGFEKSDFRTLYAFNSKEAIIANVGSPAYILRTDDGGKNWNIVYTNKDSLAFFDGVDFWNDKEGIIYGDPINGRLLLLKTNDGGKTWTELPAENRPLLAEGEASFAASGTGIRCFFDSLVIVATGGKVSRLLISENRCRTWTAFQTPIIQGKSSTGIFSFAYNYVDSLPGWSPLIIVGGDYLIDTLKKDNVFLAKGPEQMGFIAPHKGIGGYRECVEYIDRTTVVAVGPGGLDISYKGHTGTEWTPVHGQKGFHVIRKARKGTIVIAAGKKRISIVRLGTK